MGKLSTGIASRRDGRDALFTRLPAFRPDGTAVLASCPNVLPALRPDGTAVLASCPNVLPAFRPDGTAVTHYLRGYRHCVPMGRLFWRPVLMCYRHFVPMGRP